MGSCGSLHCKSGAAAHDARGAKRPAQSPASCPSSARKALSKLRQWRGYVWFQRGSRLWLSTSSNGRMVRHTPGSAQGTCQRTSSVTTRTGGGELQGRWAGITPRAPCPHCVMTSTHCIGSPPCALVLVDHAPSMTHAGVAWQVAHPLTTLAHIIMTVHEVVSDTMPPHATSCKHVGHCRVTSKRYAQCWRAGGTCWPRHWMKTGEALGKQDCVRLLLEAGANPNLQDKDGERQLRGGTVGPGQQWRVGQRGNKDAKLTAGGWAGPGILSVIVSIISTWHLPLGVAATHMLMDSKECNVCGVLLCTDSAWTAWNHTGSVVSRVTMIKGRWYTPLHMAAGYMHTQAMAVLLEGGSDPQLRDNTGKDVVKLIDNIRGNMPLNVATIMQRLRLEEVCNALTDMVYEEVGITAILDERKADDGSREFLVSFSDGREDGWVAQRNVAADILADYEAGLEYRRARAIVDMVQVGTERRFKIQWEDDYPTSWEPEEHVPPNLIALFQRQNPALFEERANAANDADASSGVKREAYATQTDDVHIALRGVHAMHSSEHAFGGDVEVLPVKAQAGNNGELLQQRHEGSGNTAAVALR
ncbi:ANK_REP_REGION domain-containing protein [Haematococcus lacustris]|uniref:ANK_REP_REGION domain-containing protein n=1 Tax=Haematococcus lacustris TaxID=44745 RepID=A0A699YM39_HAELA|nr:ANK_REP_REGION domain-containing protein [Haematococcus lacustris]